MKIIMYHYVQEFEKVLPNFRFLDIRNFKKQLDFFEENFGFISREDWNEILFKRKIGRHQGKVLLTFDDAVKCHFKYVFPELKKRGLWGIFYIPTKPFKENKLLDVHRIHLLCGAFNGKDLLGILLNNIKDEMIPDRKIKQFKEKTYVSQDNFSGVSEFKRILNYYVSYKFREELIDQVSREFGYLFDVSKFYVSKENLKLMSKDGNLIGSHTVNHPVMSKLNRKEQLFEIKDSFLFLKNLEISSEKTYCHPYGGFHTFNETTIELLCKENVMYSFNVESRDLNEKDLVNSRQFLPRYDCNEFPNGKAS